MSEFFANFAADFSDKTKAMVKPIQSVQREAWKELLESSPYASYFQSPEFYDFYSRLSFLDTFGFAAFDEAGRLQTLVCGYTIANGGRLTQYFSRRAIIQGGVLLRGDCKEFLLKELLQTLKRELRHKAIYIEIRNSFDYSKYRETFLQAGFAYQPHLNYLVDTSQGIDQVRSGYHRNRRRELRRSEESGLRAELSKNATDIEGFYSLLLALYRQKIKRPLFPQEFFSQSIEKENHQLIVIKSNENTIVGGVLLVNYGRRTYALFGTKSEQASGHPLIMAIDSAIDFACKSGATVFDFMGAGEPGKPYGVRGFKERFGGELVEYGRFRCVSSGFLFKLGSFAINFISKLKF